MTGKQGVQLVILLVLLLELLLLTCFPPLKRLQGGWQMFCSSSASRPPSPLFLSQLLC